MHYIMKLKIAMGEHICYSRLFFTKKAGTLLHCRNAAHELSFTKMVKIKFQPWVRILIIHVLVMFRRS